MCVPLLLPPPPLFRGLLGFTRCSPPLFPVSCPILHLALLSENDEARPNVPQSKLDSQPECYDLQGWEALFVQEKSVFPSGLPLQDWC